MASQHKALDLKAMYVRFGQVPTSQAMKNKEEKKKQRSQGCAENKIVLKYNEMRAVQQDAGLGFNDGTGVL